MHTGSSGTLIGWKSGQTTYVPLWDRRGERGYGHLVGSLKMNTTLEYSTRVVQEGDRRCKKSTLNDLAYLTPLRIPLMNPVTGFEPRTVVCTN
jgi:hypothetical protein